MQRASFCPVKRASFSEIELSFAGLDFASANAPKSFAKRLLRYEPARARRVTFPCLRRYPRRSMTGISDGENHVLKQAVCLVRSLISNRER
jgi:hypothetical protein